MAYSQLHPPHHTGECGLTAAAGWHQGARRAPLAPDPVPEGSHTRVSAMAGTGRETQSRVVIQQS